MNVGSIDILNCIIDSSLFIHETSGGRGNSRQLMAEKCLVNIPQFVVQNLKCFICHRYLSVSPVSGTTGKYTCGRCCPTAETCGPYEEIAKHILFPCSNAQCKTKIKWGEVTAHENACVFRKISCPFLACSNRISINEVLSHFTVDHKVLVPEHRCCISIEYSQGPPQVKIHCFSYKKIGFLVFVKTTTDVPKHTVSFGVAALPTTVPDKSYHDMHYTVNLYLSSTSGSCVLKKIGKRISQYDEDKHCVYCIVGKCNKLEHHGDDFWDVEFTGIDSNYYQDDIKCIVKVEKSFPLRESLECPICKNYMESTIYICPNGHSLCKECRFKVNTCPLCNSAMGTTRNYTLEDLAETLEVPCHNDYNGCQFIGLVAETIQHETDCYFDENLADKNLNQ